MTTAEAKAALQAQAPGVPETSFTQTLRTLRQPIEPQLIKSREGWTDYAGNKQMVDYVEWHTVADILDRCAPSWCHTIRHFAQLGDLFVVIAAISIDGVTREGVGTGPAHTETGIKKAEHDALKRAAIKFGIARDLYHRDGKPTEPGTNRAPGPKPMPAQPRAQSVADLATPKQLGLIQRLCREIQIDAETELQEAMHLDCKVEELSRRAASAFIDHLQGVALR